MRCDDAKLWAMALADGERAPAPASEIEEHLATCAECRAETAALGELSRRLSAQARFEFSDDVWPAMRARIGGAPAWPLWALPTLLLAYKLAEFLPDRAPAWWVQLIPVAISAAAFVLMRVNPFTLNTGLTAGEESES